MIALGVRIDFTLDASMTSGSVCIRHVPEQPSCLHPGIVEEIQIVRFGLLL